MKIHQNFLTYVRQLKENPLEKIEDFPSIQLIEASDFDIAIGLCEKYAHKSNRFILPTLQVSKERFLSGGESRYFRRQEPITAVNKLRMYLHSTLHKYWREEKWKEISRSVSSTT